MSENVKPPNTRLTYNERCIIARLLKELKNCSEIASIIGRGKNTVNVEIRRSGGRDKYDALRAQKESDQRYMIDRHKRQKTLQKLAKQEGYSNPYLCLKERIECLEMQIEILNDTIKELKDGKQD